MLLLVLGVPLALRFAMNDYHHLAIERINDTARLAVQAVPVLRNEEPPGPLAATMRDYESRTGAAVVLVACDGVVVTASRASVPMTRPERGLLWAAIERGLAYTDITPHLTSLGRGGGYERVDAAARANGARILLGAGLVPGISSVIARTLADDLGGADRIETALLLSADDLSGPGSFDYLLQELTMGFDVHVDGTDRPARTPGRASWPTPPRSDPGAPTCSRSPIRSSTRAPWAPAPSSPGCRWTRRG